MKSFNRQGTGQITLSYTLHYEKFGAFDPNVLEVHPCLSRLSLKFHNWKLEDCSLPNEPGDNSYMLSAVFLQKVKNLCQLVEYGIFVHNMNKRNRIFFPELTSF